MQNPRSGSASASPDRTGGWEGDGYDDEEPGVEIRWGLGDVAVGFFAGMFLSLIANVLLLSNTKYDLDPGARVGNAFGQAVGHLATGTPAVYHGLPPVPLWLTAVVQIPLWVCLLGVPIAATVTKGNGPVRDLWLRARPVDAPVGLAIGVAAQLVLLPLLYVPIFWVFGDQDVSAAARQLTDRATDPFGVVMLFLIVGIGAPIAEEVFFRGLTQRSLTRRWGAWIALFGTAAFFALTHFELLQLPALFLFGLMLGAMVFVTRRLGTSIWAHLGFNMVAAATLVWGISLPLWVLVVIGLLGLAACGYLIRSWLAEREIRTG